MKKISVVIPCYYSEKSLAIIVNDAIKTIKNDGRYDYEVILINDGSKDGTWSVIEQLASSDDKVVGINLSKNFGQHSALIAGYRAVTGDIILGVDDDGEHDPKEMFKLIDKLEEGYDFVQGSRFIPGGKAINTPFIRDISVRLIHAPIISLTAHHHFTDTTNAYRGYSARYLQDERVQPLRDVFMTYELLAYLSVRATQIGMKACEIPVTRAYPEKGKTPTKISFFKGNFNLMKILIKNMFGAYKPSKR